MIQKVIKEIDDKIWLISEYLLDNMFLVEGRDRALLIDCGVGLGDLKQEVEALTQKPIMLVATHGHFDHDGGAAPFGTIYMHEDDIAGSKLTYDQYGDQIRAYFVKTRGPVRNPQATQEELMALLRPNGEIRRLPLPEEIDLGDRTIEVIHTPGHTPGSVCFLDKERRLLFTGDMANDCVLINTPGSTSVEVYLNSMKKIWERAGEYDGICIGHDSLEVADKTIIPEYIEGATKLLAGELEGKPGDDGLHEGVCIHNKRATIWFDPDRIHE
jgi:glyoxylase-like metal-dependent hydrolase (beta-lactamase superfamily II)